jgi:DNA modification methylase
VVVRKAERAAVIYLQDADFTLYQGDALDCLAELADESVHCVVTSPPYLDARPEYDSPQDYEYAAIFKHLARVVSGPMLWNVGRLWRQGVEQLWWTGLIQQASLAGWQHWDTEVWIKPNANPIHGRVFANRHEYTLVFGRDGVLLNEDAVRVPYAESTLPRLLRGWTNHTGVKNDTGRKNGRRGSTPHPLGGRPPSYVEICTGGERGNPHPAPMAEKLAEHLVSLASWPGQTVLDPFMGSGTTARAARKHGRRSIGIELNPDYCELIAKRTQQQSLLR